MTTNTQSTDNVWRTVTVAMVIIFSVYVYCFFNVSERYRMDVNNGDQLQEAWHIALPGYLEKHYLDDTIDLRHWSGTKYMGLEARNIKTGKVNTEATAGIALKTTGLFQDYELQERGGYHVLYRPAKTERQFTWRAWYRIGPWRLAGQT